MEDNWKLPVVVVPYVTGLFENLKNFCKKEVMLIDRDDNTLKSSVFSRLKDPTPKLQQSHLVYLIPCSCGYNYVGQTMQCLKDRVDLREYNINVNNKQHSALCDHAITNRHTPLWDKVNILFRENDLKKRSILEMITIKRAPNCLNKQTDCMMLSTTHSNVI